jgi:hypothetical protein
MLERALVSRLDDLFRNDHVRFDNMRQQRNVPGPGHLQRLRDVQLVGHLRRNANVCRDADVRCRNLYRRGDLFRCDNLSG